MREKENNGNLLNINDIQAKVVDALQISLGSVSRICAKNKSVYVYKGQGKNERN